MQREPSAHDLPLTVPSAGNSEQEAKPRIKISPWRVGNVNLLLGVGTAKAVALFKGNAAANSLDMVLGLVWALVAYIICCIEADSPDLAPWLFKADASCFVVWESVAAGIVACFYGLSVVIGILHRRVRSEFVCDFLAALYISIVQWAMVFHFTRRMPVSRKRGFPSVISILMILYIFSMIFPIPAVDRLAVEAIDAFYVTFIWSRGVYVAGVVLYFVEGSGYIVYFFVVSSLSLLALTLLLVMPGILCAFVYHENGPAPHALLGHLCLVQ